MRNEYLIGKMFPTKHGGTCTITSVKNRKNLTVRFYNGYETVCTYGNLLTGLVKNPYHPTVYGIGYLGEGNFLAKMGKSIHPYYDAWRGAFRRCYSEKEALKYARYKDCEVDEQWFNYQEFCKWTDRQVFHPGYKLDKDLLYPGNKIYGPDTCVYLPNELNCIISSARHRDSNLPVGVSRVVNPAARVKIWTASMSMQGKGGTRKSVNLGYFSSVEEASAAYISEKERYVKQRAEYWKDRISIKAYEALYNWTVS